MSIKFTKMLMCVSLLFVGLVIIWCISKHAKTIVEQYGGGGHGGGGRGGGGHGGGGRGGGGHGGGGHGLGGGGHRGGGHGWGGYGRGLGAAGLGYGLGRYYGGYGGYGGGDGGSYGYLNNYYPYPVYVYDDDEVYSNYPYYSVI